MCEPKTFSLNLAREIVTSKKASLKVESTRPVKPNLNSTRRVFLKDRVPSPDHKKFK